MIEDTGARAEGARYFVALDTETGGLDPRTCALTDIAAVLYRVEPGGAILSIVQEESLQPLDLRVTPAPWLEISPQALVARGITREEIESRTDRRIEAVAAGELVDFLRKCISLCAGGRGLRQGLPVVAHNADFDRGFVEALLARTNLAQPSIIHWRDSADIERVLMQAGMLVYGSVSLAECFRRRLWGLEGHHSAMSDAQSCARLYASQMRLMRGGV